MIDKNSLEAPCGLHCGMCALNRAITDEQLNKQLSERLNLPLEKAACPSCRAIDGYCPVIGEQCATWICSKEKGVAFCSECADFPCIKLMPCADRAAKLPHNIKVYSLALRKQRGAQEWNNAIKDLYELYYKGQMIIGRGPMPST